MLGRTTQKPPLFWTLQLFGWGAFGFSMFLASVPWLPIGYAVSQKTFFTLLGMLVSLPLRAIYRRLYDRKLSIPPIILVCALCSYVAAMFWTASFSLAQEFVRDWSRGEAFSAGAWASVFSGGLYHAFVLFAWSALYFGVKHYRDLEEQTARALKAEALANQAQLRALRYQLNPHFLFNTLNGISTLVARQENAAANRMIARLSEFLRLALESSDAPEAPLASELDFIKRYLEIEQVRLGERLVVNFDIEPKTLSVAVPALILQPLVENAIRHGVAPREEGGQVEIAARIDGELLQLEVRNDGPDPVNCDAELCSGVGLSNTRARLQQLYGESFRFELRAHNGGGLAVVIGLPHRNGHLL